MPISAPHLFALIFQPQPGHKKMRISGIISRLECPIRPGGVLGSMAGHTAEHLHSRALGKEVNHKLRRICAVVTKAEADKALDPLIDDRQDKYQSAIECPHKYPERLLTCRDLPAKYGAHIRTPNPIVTIRVFHGGWRYTGIPSRSSVRLCTAIILPSPHNALV